MEIFHRKSAESPQKVRRKYEDGTEKVLCFKVAERGLSCLNLKNGIIMKRADGRQRADNFRKVFSSPIYSYSR
jgi:hypothetical protein